MNPELYILTGQVGTGKSQALERWCEVQRSKNRSIAGVLNPRVDGVKVMEDLSTAERFAMEVRFEGEEEVFKIGRFIFLENAFDRARKIITDGIDQCADVFILDEIGLLELDGKGLEPAVSAFIEQLGNSKLACVILVVRDYLVKKAITHYQLEAAEVISYSELNRL